MLWTGVYSYRNGLSIEKCTNFRISFYMDFHSFSVRVGGPRELVQTTRKSASWTAALSLKCLIHLWIPRRNGYPRRIEATCPMFCFFLSSFLLQLILEFLVRLRCSAHLKTSNAKQQSSPRKCSRYAQNYFARNAPIPRRCLRLQSPRCQEADFFRHARENSNCATRRHPRFLRISGDPQIAPFGRHQSASRGLDHKDQRPLGSACTSRFVAHGNRSARPTSVRQQPDSFSQCPGRDSRECPGTIATRAEALRRRHRQQAGF